MATPSNRECMIVDMWYEQFHDTTGTGWAKLAPASRARGGDMKDYTILVVPTWLMILLCGTVIANGVMTIISETIKHKAKAAPEGEETK